MNPFSLLLTHVDFLLAPLGSLQLHPFLNRSHLRDPFRVKSEGVRVLCECANIQKDYRHSAHSHIRTFAHSHKTSRSWPARRGRILRRLAALEAVVLGDRAQGFGFLPSHLRDRDLEMAGGILGVGGQHQRFVGQAERGRRFRSGLFTQTASVVGAGAVVAASCSRFCLR